jgi:hypothetical protein
VVRPRAGGHYQPLAPELALRGRDGDLVAGARHALHAAPLDPMRAYGKPLVKDGSPPLGTMMRQLHEWYMKTCRGSGKNTLLMSIKDKHDFIGQELIIVEFDEFFQLYNQKDIDKSILTCYCL